MRPSCFFLLASRAMRGRGAEIDIEPTRNLAAEIVNTLSY